MSKELKKYNEYGVSGATAFLLNYDFSINDCKNYLNQYGMPGDPEPIHVIEYTAFEHAATKCEEAQSELLSCRKELDTVIKIGVEGQREINRKLSEENKKLMAREEIYKSIIKKQAEVLEHYKQDFDHDPSEDEIEKDYDCGCCSVGAAGARAFVVLKEVSKMMEEIEGEK